MQKILPLKDHIIARIAAGEVIERPAFAVKELIENSLDAGASSISIHIEDSGLKKIIVTDNGSGMTKEDLLESYKHHTTSKLRDDFASIKTLGFRGEALSSIAAISNIVIQSRRKGDISGFEVRVRTGDLEGSGPVGMPYGTTVMVENLFSSVPARRKFLKSARTEFRHIAELVTQYALSFPEIKFLLTHNKKTILNVPGKQTLYERISGMLGNSLSAHLLPITSDESPILVTGYIAHPQLHSKTQSKQYVFVNNRVVSDRLISTAVKEAFGNLLEPTSHPIFFINISLPYESVDVNVHPRKEQVSFMNHGEIFQYIKFAAQETLSEHNLTFHNVSFNSSLSTKKGTTLSYAAGVLKDRVEPWSVKDIGKLLKKSEVLQIHNTYLLAQTENGIIVVDQHAAHERILYEQYLSEFQKNSNTSDSHSLRRPITIELPVFESESVLENIHVLKEIGFEIESFGGSTFKISAVPKLFQDRDIERLLSELLENLHIKNSIEIDSVSITMIEFLACRGAIMAGDILTCDEAKKLIEKLEITPRNATCPHGRPTKIEVNIHELHKLFKRV